MLSCSKCKEIRDPKRPITTLSSGVKSENLDQFLNLTQSGRTFRQIANTTI